MIHLDFHFHWCLIPMVCVIFLGIYGAYRSTKKYGMGLGEVLGFIVLLICILIAIAIGGVFLW